MTETEIRPRLHDAETTSKILGGIVSERWLEDRAAAGDIPCTRLGRSVGWTDDNITQLLAENCFDSTGRKVGRK